MVESRDAVTAEPPELKAETDPRPGRSLLRRWEAVVLDRAPAFLSASHLGLVGEPPALSGKMSLAEAAALKGKKKRAKTDWADARHLRELLLIGRLPESWIPPGHLLDLRARVRTRHLLSHQRTEWQQRVRAGSRAAGR